MYESARGHARVRYCLSHANLLVNVEVGNVRLMRTTIE